MKAPPAQNPAAALHARAQRSLRAGNAAEAAALLKQALDLHPGSGALHAELAAALWQQGSLEMAAKHYAKAARLAPSQPQVQQACGHFLLQTGKYAEAQRCFRKALNLAPGDPAALEGLGLCLQRQKKPDEAEGFFSKALAVSPHRAQALYGLGHIMDERGDADRAFAFFRQANEAQARDPAARAVPLGAFPAIINEYRQLVSSGIAREWTAPPLPEDRPAPVFLVGFPRSGTTLLDQIFSGHSDIEVVEELPALAKAGNHLINAKKKSLPQCLASLTGPEITVLREIYFGALEERGFALKPGGVLIDKLPLNMVYTPFIRRLFPDAKFILALRHPCDAVLSCYLQPFALNEAMIHFLGLERAARLYGLCLTAWEEAVAGLGLETHIIRYENVVTGLKEEIAGALRFLGREWQEGIEAFDDTARRRAIKTPSAAQVTQKIYTGASGRWQRYYGHLAPHLGLLAPWAEAFGYATARN